MSGYAPVDRVDARTVVENAGAMGGNAAVVVISRRVVWVVPPSSGFLSNRVLSRALCGHFRTSPHTPARTNERTGSTVYDNSAYLVLLMKRSRAYEDLVALEAATKRSRGDGAPLDTEDDCDDEFPRLQFRMEMESDELFPTTMQFDTTSEITLTCLEECLPTVRRSSRDDMLMLKQQANGSCSPVIDTSAGAARLAQFNKFPSKSDHVRMIMESPDTPEAQVMRTWETRCIDPVNKRRHTVPPFDTLSSFIMLSITPKR